MSHKNSLYAISPILITCSQATLAITVEEAKTIPVDQLPTTRACADHGQRRDKCIGVDGGGEYCKPISDPTYPE